MKSFQKILLAVVLGGLLAAAPLLASTTASNPAKPAKPAPGIEAAQTISMITGVAISPLLGVSAVGAYQYLHTAETGRAKLPWYAQPWFWVPALLLVAAVAFKDSAGAALPPGWKKPFDVAETVENKVSGLVAAGAFVPLVAKFFPETVSQDTAAALNSCLAGHGFAAIDASAVLNALTVPFALAAFGLVWLVSHTVHILILLSPWGAIDAALKSARAFLLALVTGTALLNPYLGAALSVVIIIIAYFLAGWSFRLMVFGQVYVWDFVTFRRFRFTPSDNGNWMFLARENQGVPTRTYGRLIRDEAGRLDFEYRPWLWLPKRTLELPEGKYAVGKGLIYSEIISIDGEKSQSVFILPPRYGSQEETLGRIYGLPVRDVGLLKGFKAVWNWLWGRKASVAPAV